MDPEFIRHRHPSLILSTQSSRSVLSLVFGLENSVDFFSSVIVLWRFYYPGAIDKQREAMLQKREKRASIGTFMFLFCGRGMNGYVHSLSGFETLTSPFQTIHFKAISFVLGILGIAVISTSTHALLRGGIDTSALGFIIVLSFLGTFVLGAMCVIKFQYAAKLDSASMYKDGICSTIGCILAIFLFLNSLIIEHAPKLWWLDPFVALLCGVASLGIGGHAIVVAKKQGLPIFTRSWWMLSQGDGHDEMDGRRLEQADFGEGVEMPDATKLSDVV